MSRVDRVMGDPAYEQRRRKIGSAMPYIPTMILDQWGGFRLVSPHPRPGGGGGGPGAACAATRPTPSVYARTINDLLKKLKRRLTWQWGQAGEDMLDEANNCGGCGVPRSESQPLAMYYRGLHRGHK